MVFLEFGFVKQNTSKRIITEKDPRTIIKYLLSKNILVVLGFKKNWKTKSDDKPIIIKKGGSKICLKRYLLNFVLAFMIKKKAATGTNR